MAFSLVNHTSNRGTSATTGTVSPGWTIAAGDLLVVAISAGSSNQLAAPTVTDSAHNTYTIRSGIANAPATNGQAFWIADTVVTTGGSGITITATFNAAAAWSLTALEYSFAGTLGHGATAAAQGGSSPIAPGSLSLSGSGRLVVVGGGLALGTTFTPSSGYTIRESNGAAGAGTQKFAVEDATGQSGTISPTIAASASATNWAGAAAAYYEIAASSRRKPRWYPGLSRKYR